jgi:hypothetical protein
MPKQSQYYKLGYFADGEFMDSTTEARRFETIDSQMFGLYSVLGNGTLEGWQLVEATGDAFSVVVGPGRGVISNVYVETKNSNTVGPLSKNSVNYIYASITESSYWNQTVSFSAYLGLGNRENSVFIGAVTVGADKITKIDTSEKAYIGLVSSIQEVIASHRHNGAEGQPSPVDLGSEVQGQIRQSNLPELDASIISTGKLDPLRIPTLDHDKALANKGTLTHAQLDAFVEQLSHKNANLMGETAMVNLLQLILSLKHQYPEIDDYLLNEIAFIPGISPDSMVDWDNTTATVDTRTALEGGSHTISGSPGPSFELFTKSWDTQDEFAQASLNNVTLDGDLIRLLPTETTAYVEDFEEVSDWQTSITDLSTGGSVLTTDGSTKIGGLSSGSLKLNVDGNTNLAFVMEKTFQSQDWSSYNRIVFHIKTDVTDHGDIFFYLRDAQAGTQDSFKMVLETGAPTINRDTLLQGWREIDIDISSFERSSIVSVGFYMSSETGWEPSKPFTMNIDEMYLTTGNIFVPTGYARFTYGNGTPLDFYRIRWEGLMDSGIRVRTRLGMNLSDFDEGSPNQSTWSSYQSSSGLVINNPSGILYPYIQIESFFTSQSGGAVSPELQRLHLDFRSSSSEASFSYDTKDEWEAGTLVNIDSWTTPGQITIANTSEVGGIVYSNASGVARADNQLQDILTVTGASIPRSTKQAILGLPSSFGQLSGVARGESGTFWLTDTDNDRVVEVNAAGGLVRGFYGSFLTPPVDAYGYEERGPGSNEDESLSSVAVEPSQTSQKVAALHSIYNPSTRVLSVVFNQNIEDVHGDSIRVKAEDFYLGAKTHRIYFNEETTMSLLGIDGAKKDLWKNADNVFKDQFSFSSHILNIGLSQADAASLSSIVDFATPAMVLVSPKYNQEMPSGSVSVEIGLSNFQLGGTDNNRIKWRIDYGSYQHSLVESFSISGLLDGSHVLEAWLVDGNDNKLQNAEASLISKFVVNTSLPITEPMLLINSPNPNQIIPSSPITVAFESINHPILPYGSHLRYSVDGGVTKEHRDYSPISISSLDTGTHLLKVWLADELGNKVISEYAEADITFFIGANAMVGLKLYIEKDAVRGEGGDQATGCKSHFVNVDTANISMCNIFSPIDVQFIPSEISSVNPSGEPSILISKLRSPSWSSNLGPVLSVKDSKSIFGSVYMDGHSVVQMNMSGDVIFSNNAARFAGSLEEAKKTLGSAEKISDNELLIADAVRNRAIITLTDLANGKTFISWQYDSDRAVSDFHLIDNREVSISVGLTGISKEIANVKYDTSVTWKNDTAVPIQIFSGRTTQSQFDADPDLTLYGDEFLSPSLNPGEEFNYKFTRLGENHWFSYDGVNILPGLVQVSQGRISSTDQYLMVENDPNASVFGSRVIKVDSWGNVIWSFGQDWLHSPKDARPSPDGSVLISN